MNKRERRLIAVAFVLVFLFTAQDFAARTGTKKQINILGSLGIATSDIEEPLIDIGVEFELAQGLYFRLEVNTHLGSGDNYYYDPLYYDWYYPGIGLNDGAILHGFSTSGVYKVPLSKKLRFFIQAGLNYMFYWRDVYDNVYFTWRREKKNGPGVAFGSGFELDFSGKIGFIGGGIYRQLFKDEAQWHPDIPAAGQPAWLKIYIGLYYKVR
ncbi:MAG: hypothetical protein PVH61_07810 [Candidatus Aminicenantes bacterium]|jgi:hypothetical protein